MKSKLKNKLLLWLKDKNLEEKINSSPLYLLLISVLTTYVVLNVLFLFA